MSGARSQIQLGSLRDLSAMVSPGEGDFNLALSIILEGIYRGIGMDRVIFALFTPDRQYLTGKHGLGRTDEGWVENCRSALEPKAPNIFGHFLANSKPVWVKENRKTVSNRLLNMKLSI